MSDLIRKKLEEDCGVAGWELLQPHQKRDALFLVDEGLDLVTVGVAVAQDDALQLNGWLEAGEVSRPTKEELAAWSENPTSAPSFSFVIVQPFVFAKIQTT